MAKKLKRFDFKKPPKNPMKFWNWVARMISVNNLKKRDFKLNEYNTQGLKPPYILLSNHASMVDFMTIRKVCYPNRVNNVASVETFHDYPYFIYKHMGVLPKRRYTKDLYLIKNIKYSLDKLGNIFCLYPEARFSLDGTPSYIPDSLGKLLKLFKVPVALLILKGNYITRPMWNQKEKMSHVEGDFKKIFTPEELEHLSVDEINARIKKEFQYDDFAWQKKNNIIIDDKDRAYGLHKLLYQCPHCGKEFKMQSGGTEIWCEECGKHWEMGELGDLKALSGETEFSHIPDWYKWERANVRREIEEGNYCIEDDVRIDTLPSEKGFIKQGTGHFYQDENGIRLTGTAYGKPFELVKEPLEQECIHTEFDYPHGGDSFEIATSAETYWLYPLNEKKKIMKISLATEELFLRAKETLKKNLSLKKSNKN